jgi:lipoprotein NlpD
MTLHGKGRRQRLAPAGAALALAAATVAGCSSGSDRRADVEIRGTDPGAIAVATTPSAATAPATAPATAAVPGPGVGAAPDAAGIVSYDGYQTVVARDGDSVADLAGRVGLSASELAAYNGLTPGHPMLAGDELVLPPRPGGYGSGTAVAAAPTASAISGATDPIEQAPLPAAGTPVDPAAPPGGWSPEMAAAAIDRSTGLNSDGSLGAPPSSAEPVPPEPAPRRELESPELNQYQTGVAAAPTAAPTEERVVAAAPNLRLQKPVDGPVAIPFNKGAGPERNDGVDFAAPAGAPVLAAADGEVALVSQSLGGLGTIVLVRHGGDLLTVYGRVDGVSVAKGDPVSQGQQIGVVSNATAGEPRMHFEVRRGAESLDPMQFL